MPNDCLLKWGASSNGQYLFPILMTKVHLENPFCIYCTYAELFTTARWLSWLKRLTSNEEIPSSNLGRAFLF